jgi:hypothetical protein
MSTGQEIRKQAMFVEEVATYTFHQRDQRRRFGGHRCFIKKDDWEINIPQF